MISVYYSEHGVLRRVQDISAGSWVDLCAPTPGEINRVCAATGADAELLRAALDEEERSRIDFENGSTLILVDTPTVEAQEGGSYVYSTLPFGIVLVGETIITVCLKETALARAFAESTVKMFSTKKKNRATLQLLYRNSSLFLYYLREVDKASNRVESQLHISMKNKELIQMLALEKSLVYFSTSLKSNEAVLEKLARMSFIRNYPDDAELLEDVIIENKQAIEMCAIYRDILSGMMDAFASVISNNLNIVMKVLASVTIILTVPNIVFSLWGTNVPVPFANTPYGFWAVVALAAGLTLASLGLMKQKEWL